MNKVKHAIIMLFFFGNFFSQKDTLKKFNLCFETIAHTNGFLRLFAKESLKKQSLVCQLVFFIIMIFKNKK